MMLGVRSCLFFTFFWKVRAKTEIAGLIKSFGSWAVSVKVVELRLDHSGIWDSFDLHTNGIISAMLPCNSFSLKNVMVLLLKSTNVNLSDSLKWRQILWRGIQHIFLNRAHAGGCLSF